MAAKQEEPSTRLCGYCKQHIQEEKFELHEIGCQKYFTLCEVCNQPVPRSELDQHNEEEHTEVPCDLCGEKLFKEQLEPHKETTCPDYRILCKYCQLEIRRDDHESHIEACGSRTDLCELCGQRVILRDMYEHQQNKCPHMKADEALDITQLQQFQDQRQDLFGALLSGSALGGGGGFGLPSAHHHPLGFDVSSPHHHQPVFVHPFVPLPTGINRDQSYPREPDPPPPRDQSYPREPYPLSPSDPHEGENVHIDPQWLATVANVCGEERLDSVLAQNMAVEDSKRHNPPLYSPPGSPHVHAHKGGLGTVQTHSGFARGAEMRRGQYSPQSEVHMQQRDAELARELYEGDVAYAQRYDIPFDGQETSSDAILAKQIYDREMSYCESQERDRELAREMQEEEERRVEYNRRAGVMQEEEMAKRDHELAKQAQEGERLAQYSGRGGIQEGGVAYQAQQRDHEEEEERRARERELAYNEFQKKDHELAKQMQEEEQLALGGYHGDMGRDPVAQSGYHNPGLEEDTVFRDERDSVRGRLHETTDVRGYDRAVLDNEEPRPKTPPLKVKDAGKIPCEFCNKLYPFEMISDHQLRCYPAPTAATPTVVYIKPTDGSFFPPSMERGQDPPPQSTEERGVAYPSSLPSTQWSEKPPPSTQWREEPSPYTEKRKDYTPSTHWREEPSPSSDYIPSTDYTLSRKEPSPSSDYTLSREEPSPYTKRQDIPSTQWSEKPPPTTDYTQWREEPSQDAGDLRPQDPVYGLTTHSTDSDSHTSITASSHSHVTEGHSHREMEDDKCPCEGCGELFSMKELMKHESICRFRKYAQAKIPAAIQNGEGRNPPVGGGRVDPQAPYVGGGRVNLQASVGGGRVNPQAFVGGERSTRPTAATTKSAVPRGRTKLAIKFPNQEVSHETPGPLLGTKMDTTTNQQHGVVPAMNIGRGRQRFTHNEGIHMHRTPGHNGSGVPPLMVEGVKIKAGPALQDRRKPPVT